MEDSIVLIGFMGSGKSSVGKCLANMLGVTHIDTDSLIELKNKMTINEIFEKKGESFFRKEEYKVIHGLKKDIPVVISCGGGSVLEEDNVDYLHSIGVIVYLRAKYESIVNRLNDSTNRPLFRNEDDDFQKRTKDLMHKRENIYAKACDFFIDTDDLNPDEVATKIKKMLKY